ADMDRYRGSYEAGWNAIREQRFERQKQMGVIPAHGELPGDDLDLPIPRWEHLDEADRRLFAAHMEAYAAAVDEVDQSVGAVVAQLEELGELDNTIIVLASDNGGTAEGGLSGTRSYFSQFALHVDLPEDWVRDVPRDPDLIGGPQTFAQYPAGWARVSNTPFRAFKASTYEGGVHAPLIISWPARAAETRALRD